MFLSKEAFAKAYSKSMVGGKLAVRVSTPEPAKSVKWVDIQCVCVVLVSDWTVTPLDSHLPFVKIIKIISKFDLQTISFVQVIATNCVKSVIKIIGWN
jgi:hypothetical protein